MAPGWRPRISSFRSRLIARGLRLFDGGFGLSHGCLGGEDFLLGDRAIREKIARPGEIGLGFGESRVGLAEVRRRLPQGGHHGGNLGAFQRNDRLARGHGVAETDQDAVDTSGHGYSDAGHAAGIEFDLSRSDDFIFGHLSSRDGCNPDAAELGMAGGKFHPIPASRSRRQAWLRIRVAGAWLAATRQHEHQAESQEENRLRFHGRLTPSTLVPVAASMVYRLLANSAKAVLRS